MTLGSMLTLWLLYGLAAMILQFGYMYMVKELVKSPTMRVAVTIPLVLGIGAGIYYALQYLFIVGFFRAIK